MTNCQFQTESETTFVYDLLFGVARVGIDTHLRSRSIFYLPRIKNTQKTLKQLMDRFPKDRYMHVEFVSILNP